MMDTATLHRLALMGAQVRIAAIEEEMKALQVVLVQCSPKPAKRIKLTKHADGAYSARRLHWTQRPENAAKVARMSRKGARTRRANARQ